MRSLIAVLAFASVATGCLESGGDSPVVAGGCSAAEPCPAGNYCSADGTCTRDCRLAPVDPCPGMQMCGSGGRCEIPLVDGINSCAAVKLAATRVTPTVILIIDQSSSMVDQFDASGSRWEVLRETILGDPGGLLKELEGAVEFGVALYSSDGVGNGPRPPDQCPLITNVDPALNNHAAIETAYRAAEPIGDTPTGAAIDSVLSDYLARPDPDPDPAIFIVGTDGEPDTCEQPNPNEGQDDAVAAAERAFDEGIRTFMLSVGDEVGEEHLQDMANAGLGVGPGSPDAQFWVATDDGGLRTALRDIIGGVLSCDVTLEGTIDVATACTGEVVLNGNPIFCDDPNGWEPVDGQHIRLLGEACTQLTEDLGVTLDATFPCETVLF